MNSTTHLIDVVAGPDGGRQLRLAPGRHLIGRAAGLSVRLDDPSVEAHHAMLDIAADGDWELSQLCGRSPIGFDRDRGVIEIGCSRLERGSETRPAERLDGGWVQLGIGLDPALPDDGDDVDDVGDEPSAFPRSFPDMTVVADLGDRRSEIVGVVDATGGVRGDGVRPAVRSIVAQLAGRPGWTMIDLSIDVGLSVSDLEAIARDGSRPLLLTNQAGLVRGADSPIPAGLAAGVALTVIVVTTPGAPVIEACSSVLEIGPRWRARWHAAGGRASGVRLHAVGISAARAGELSVAECAGAGGAIVAQ